MEKFNDAGVADIGGGGAGGAGGQWAFCAKTTKAADGMGLAADPFNVYRNVVNTAIVPQPEFVNPAVAYVGNGRFQNNTGAPLNVKGVVQGTPHTVGLQNYNLFITVGLWDGANIVPEVAKELNWPTTVNFNIANSNIDEHTYEYDLVVPDGDIWGLAVKRTNDALIDSDIVWRTFSHLVRGTN